MSSELVFGDIDWNSADASGGTLEFMRLQEGANVVRILGNPQQFYVNWLTLPGGKKKKVNTPDSPELAQRLEDAGFKRQARWFLKVLDRKDNKFKLLEISKQVFLGVKNLYNNKKWGKVTEYDITINKGKPNTQPLYNVTPDPHEPLDGALKEAYLEFKENLKIERLLAPSDPEYVCNLMGWEMGEVEAESSGSDDAFGEDGEEDYDFD